MEVRLHTYTSTTPRRCWRSSLVLRNASTSTLSSAAPTSAFCLPLLASYRPPLTASSSLILLLAISRARLRAY